PQQVDRCRGSPCLRGAGGGIGDGGAVFRPVETAHQFGKPAVERGGGVEYGDGDTLRVLHEAVTHESCDDDRVVVRPHGAVVVAHGVVGTHGRREGADPP